MDNLPDFDMLLAFDAIARTRNMRLAAETLHITQPPLSRRLQRLEASLGFTLFERHSRGLELTDRGKDVLKIIQPLLREREKAAVKLGNLAKIDDKKIRIGITTAFEQGVFFDLIEIMAGILAPGVIRKSSPQLVKALLRGQLDAAFIALPTPTYDLQIVNLPYEENIVAVIPEIWLETEEKKIDLRKFNGKKLFWFQRAANQDYFDMAYSAFKEAGYCPEYIQEPPEHDVLLSRIANGEALSLMPESFSKISRQGIKFLPVYNLNMQVRLGLVWRYNISHHLLEKVKTWFKLT